MRRPVLIAARIVVFALIGAAATVLVAWGCPHFGPEIGSTLERAGTRRWESIEIPQFDFDPGPVAELQSRRRGLRAWYRASHDPPRITVVVNFGLPLQSLTMRHTSEKNARSLGGVAVPNFLVTNQPELAVLTAKRLPVLPLWPGFLVDTAFWGGAAFVVWSGPGFVRRRARRRRGRCVRCGYELAGVGGGVCPECGGAA